MRSRGDACTPFLQALWLVLGLMSGCALQCASGGPRETEDARRASDCPSIAVTSNTGALEPGSLTEVSGLVASRKQPGLYWVHNDSGDEARVFAIELDGRVQAEIALSGVEARDLEDIAIGPGPVPGVHYLYLADTGDNWRRREGVRIYRIEEPTLARNRQGQRLAQKPFTIELSYEDGPRDAEALFIDPHTRDLYVVAKRRLFSHEWNVGVYRLEAAAVDAGRVVARKVTSVGLGPTTAADMRADGLAIVVRNYRTALYWTRAPGESVALAMARPACELPLSDAEGQGESFGFTAQGDGYVTTSEGARAPLYLTRFGADTVR